MEDFRTRARRALSEGGVPRLAKKLAVVGVSEMGKVAMDVWYKITPSARFSFRENEYSYLRHTYNNATHNERTVEVPLVWEKVKQALKDGKRVLEVGNVLSNYYKISHDILDKYEPGRNIINEDALTWRPAHPYDLIVSISTMEHVGWDEEPRTPEKILAAFRNLIDNCLAPGGELIATMPLGYNSYLDESLANGSLKFSDHFFMKRVTSDNLWRQASWEEVQGTAYGSPFPNANAIIFAVQQKP